MGLAQDLKTIVKAANILKSYNIYFKFIGDGVCKSEIEMLAKPFNEKIDFCEPMPRNELIKHIMKSSVCLVPLRDKKIFNSALPSKMFEYMACGKPIIASVKGEAKKVINDSGSGIVVYPENAKQLSDAILTYFNDSKKCKVDGKKGMKFALSNLSKEVLILNMLNKIKSE